MFIRLNEMGRAAYRGSYGIRFFYILFRETRKRLEALILHFMILYILVFLVSYHFYIFVKPSAMLIQLVIVYIVV